jgi:hypothetical protein
MKEFFDKLASCFTDKSMVIIALTIIAIMTLIVMQTMGENIVTAIVSGLCGIAVGSSLKDGPKG